MTARVKTDHKPSKPPERETHTYINAKIFTGSWETKYYINKIGYKILTSHILSYNPLTTACPGSSLWHAGFSSCSAWA